MNMPVEKQKGVALLFVLLIFAIITTVATKMVIQTQRNTERQAQYLHQQQAQYYALGAEQYVAMLLEKDSLSEKRVDHWHSPWADDHQLPMVGGGVEIQVIDEQALLNLNLLQGEDGQKQIAIFERLFTRLQINAQLAERIRNWGSSDPQKRIEEDSLYMSMVPPIRTGGGELNSVSELKLMQLLDAESYKKLRPFVTVLPQGIGVNLNTVPQELLPVIFSELSDSEAAEIVEARGKSGFENLEAMRKHPALEGKKINWQTVQGTFFSQYFSAYIKANYGRVTYYLHSLLARDDRGKVVVISREEGDYPQWVSALRRSVRHQ